MPFLRRKTKLMRYFKCSFQWDKKINIFVQMRMPRPILGIDNRLSTAFKMYTFRAQFKWNYKQIFEQIYPASGIHGADTTKENDRIIKSESKCRQTCTETTTDRNEWKKLTKLAFLLYWWKCAYLKIVYIRLEFCVSTIWQCCQP